MMLFLFVICLRRPTFVTAQKWAKSRPSGAGEADFPQISFEDSQSKIAYESGCCYKVGRGMEWCGKS
jgi:hypothetical protein